MSLDAGEFRHIDLPAPPVGATFALRPAGFVVSVSTQSAQARLLSFIAVVWTGLTVFFLLGGFSVWERLLGIPFLAGAGLLGWQAMMRAGGRITVVRDGVKGRVVQGAGWFVLTRRFRWAEVMGVEVEEMARVKRVVVRRAAGDLRFGGLLNEEARGYLMAVIREGMRG